MNSKICLLPIALLLLSTACSGGGGDDSSGGGSLCSTAKVINGEPCASVNSSVVSVQAIHDTGLLTICNGAVIAPTKVLTSATCMEILAGQAGATGNLSSSDTISVFVGTKKVKGTTYKLHPRYRVLDLGTFKSEYDIAVLDLAEKVSVRTVRLATQPATSGAEISVFEYSVGTLGKVELGALSAGKMIVTSTPGATFNAAATASGQTITDNVSGAPAFLLNAKGSSQGLVGLGQNANPTDREFLNLLDPEVSSFITSNIN